MSKYVFLFFYMNICFASENYQQKNYAPKNSSPSSAVISSQARDGVLVQSLKMGGEKILVKGSYSQKSDFKRFLSKLKGEDLGFESEVLIKKSSTFLARITTHSFEAEVENAC